MCKANFITYTLVLLLLALLGILMWLSVWMEQGRIDKLQAKGNTDIDKSVIEMLKFIGIGIFVLFFCLSYHFVMLHFVYRRWPDVSCSMWLDIAWDFCFELPFNNWFNQHNQQPPHWIPNWFDRDHDDDTIAPPRPPSSIDPPSTTVFEPSRPLTPPPSYEDTIRNTWRENVRMMLREPRRGAQQQNEEDIEMQVFPHRDEDNESEASTIAVEDFTRPLPYHPPTLL